MKKLLILLIVLGCPLLSIGQVIYSSDSVIVPSSWLKATKERLKKLSHFEELHHQLKKSFDSIAVSNQEIINSTNRALASYNHVVTDRDRWKEQAMKEIQENTKLKKIIRNDKILIQKQTHEIVSRRSAETFAIKYYRYERPAILIGALLWLPVLIIIRNDP